MSLYLLNTPCGYYFRIKVPLNLRSVVKKREIKIPLHTEVKSRAARLAMQHAVRYHDYFDRLRGYNVSDPLFTTIRMASFELLPTGVVKFTADFIDPDKVDDELKLVNGIISGMSKLNPSHFVPTIPAPAEPAGPSKLLSIVLDDYCADKGVTWDDKYRKGMMSSFRMAMDVLGDKSVTEYTVENRNNFAEILKKVPVSWDKRAEFVGKSIEEIIKINSKIGASTISRRTQKSYYDRLRWLFDWIVSEKKYSLDKNPFAGIKFPKLRADNQEREAFSDDDLRLIFNTPTFTEHSFKAPYEYWLPLISLYTGMRMGEIAQLQMDDVFTLDDCLCINITPAGDEDYEKSVKTLSSIRVVPVHPHLIELGFNEYIDSLRTTKQPRLFPEAPYKNNGYSYAPSKAFGVLMRSVGFAAGSGKNFHSFRHTLATRLDRFNISELAIGQITGHVNSVCMTGKRYIKTALLRERVEIISKLDFCDVLSAVKPYIYGR